MKPISRTLALILGAGAAIIAVAFVAIVLVVMTMSPEERVADRAADENLVAGTMADPITRFDRALAQGTTLVMRYTIVDTWREGISPVVREHLGPGATLQDVAALIPQAVLPDACAIHKAIDADGVTVRFEYRDETGQTLGLVEATASNC